LTFDRGLWMLRCGGVHHDAVKILKTRLWNLISN